MSSRERDMSALLERLKAEFLTQLEGYLATLRQHTHFAAGGARDGHKASVARVAHNLAGTGTSYGFPEVTRTARALEHALADGSADSAVRDALGALEAACSDALAQGRVSDAPTGAAEPPSVTGSEAPHHPLDTRPTLLIADDDGTVRDLVAALFAEDARVITAAGGTEALRLVRDEEPDLVLLDQDMPDLKGTKVLEMMAAEDRLSRCAAIMLTANDDSTDIARAIAMGAVDYVVKPFEGGALAARVRAVLARIRMTVVIADDDRAVTTLLATKLRLSGLRVVVAENGTDALMKIRRYRPQLAILDRMMPGLDGLAALLAIRRDAALAAMPVVLLTAKRHERDVVEGLRCGASDYVAKPFSPDELIVRCLRLLPAAA